MAAPAHPTGRLTLVGDVTVPAAYSGRNSEHVLLLGTTADFGFSNPNFGFRDQLYHTPDFEDKLRAVLKKAAGGRTTEELTMLRQWCEGIPFFQNISDHIRSKVYKYLTIKTCGSDSSVIGGASDTNFDFFIVFHGKIDVADFNERIVCQLRKGDSFGERSLVSEIPKTSSFTAVGDVEVIVLTAKDYGRIRKEEDAGDYDSKQAFLSSLPTFNNLGKERIQQVSKLLQTRTYPQHTNIVKPGQENNTFFLIQEGDCRVVKNISKHGWREEDQKIAQSSKTESGGAVLVTPRQVITPRNLADVRHDTEVLRIDVATLSVGEYFGSHGTGSSKSDYGLIANSHVHVLTCNKKELMSILGREVVEKMKSEYEMRVLYREERLSYISDEVQTEIVGLLSSKKKSSKENMMPPSQSQHQSTLNQTTTNLGATTKSVAPETPAPGSPQKGATPVPKLRLSAMKSSNMTDMNTARSSVRGPAPPEIPLSSRYPIA